MASNALVGVGNEVVFGQDVSATVFGFGTLTVSSGGAASATIVDSGGKEVIVASGFATGAPP